jgi:hypothetical protein
MISKEILGKHYTKWHKLLAREGYGMQHRRIVK